MELFGFGRLGPINSFTRNSGSEKVSGLFFGIVPKSTPFLLEEKMVVPKVSAIKGLIQ